MTLFGYNIEAEYIICSLAGVILLLLIFDIIQFVKISKIKKRQLAFMEGKDAKSLEEEITSRFAEIKSLNERETKSEEDIAKIFKTLENTFQKRAVVRYDAFREAGGLQSFVVALLDEKNNGSILNCVYSSRQGTYVYLREIKEGMSEIELSEEEQQALNTAKLQ